MPSCVIPLNRQPSTFEIYYVLYSPLHQTVLQLYVDMNIMLIHESNVDAFFYFERKYATNCLMYIHVMGPGWGLTG